jgi:protein transport protein SEC20
MGTSKQLITALEKSDWLDRLLIITALVFFFLVVLFILKQRIVDRGLRIAFWWTRFLPTGVNDLNKLERGENMVGTASFIASSVMASAASILAGVDHTVLSSTAADATLSPSLSSVISSEMDLPRTTDPVDSNLGVRDEL